MVKSVLLAELNLEIPFIQEILLGVDPAVLTTSNDRERLEHFAKVLSKAGAIVEVTQRSDSEELGEAEGEDEALLDLSADDPFSVDIMLEERPASRGPQEPTKVWNLSIDESDSVDEVLESLHDEVDEEHAEEETSEQLPAPEVVPPPVEAPPTPLHPPDAEPALPELLTESVNEPEQLAESEMLAALDSDDLDLSLGSEPAFEPSPQKKSSLDDFDDDLALAPMPGLSNEATGGEAPLGFEEVPVVTSPPPASAKPTITVPPQAAPSKILQPSAPLLDLGLDDEPEPAPPPPQTAQRQEAPKEATPPPTEPPTPVIAPPPSAAPLPPTPPVSVMAAPRATEPPTTEGPDARLKSLAISINNLSLNTAEESAGRGSTTSAEASGGTAPLPQEIILAPSTDAPRWSAFFQSAFFQEGRGGRQSTAREYGIPLAIGIAAICLGNALFFTFLAPEHPTPTNAIAINPQALLGSMDAPAATAVPNPTATPLPPSTGKLRLEKSDGLGTFSVQCDQFGEHLMRCTVSGGMKEPPKLTPEEIVKQKTPPLWIRHYESDPFFLHREDDGSLIGSTTSRLVLEQDGQRGRTSATTIAELKRVKDSLRLYVRMSTSPISSASTGDPNLEESSIGGTIRAPEVTYRRWVTTE